MIFLYLLFLRLISSLVFQRIYSILSHPIICHIFYFSILPSLREWCQSIFIILHEARDFLAKHGVKLDCCDLLFQETPLVVPPPLLSDTKMDYISKLPNCTLSYIQSMLSMKDMLNTNVLSKRWCNLCYLKRDLKFDVFHVLGSEEELLEKGYIVDVMYYRAVKEIFSDVSRNEFVKKVDQFIKNFKGTEIDSLLVEFSLRQENSSTIDQWINFSIARGVRRIDLLLLGKFSREFVDGFDYDGCYKFPFGLFSNSDSPTVRDMHLRYCLVYQETNFDSLPFTNLRSLVLEDSQVDEILIKTLLDDCLLLEELSLIRCKFNTQTLNIKSPSLSILKLQDYELEWDGMWIDTPALKSIHLVECIEGIAAKFHLLANLPQLEILTLETHNVSNINVIEYFNVNVNMEDFRLENLKQLNLIYGSGAVSFDIFWLSIIIQACPVLHKLSIMIKWPEFYPRLRQIRDVQTFSHGEIKVIELGDCVGNFYEIEIAMNALKYFHKLERIILSPSKYWKHDRTWPQNGRERILAKLQSEGIGLDKLVLI